MFIDSFFLFFENVQGAMVNAKNNLNENNLNHFPFTAKPPMIVFGLPAPLGAPRVPKPKNHP